MYFDYTIYIELFWFYLLWITNLLNIEFILDLNWKVICKRITLKRNIWYIHKRLWLRKQLCRIWLLIVGCRSSSSSGRFHKMNNFLTSSLIASCFFCYITYLFWHCATSKIVLNPYYNQCKYYYMGTFNTSTLHIKMGYWNGNGILKRMFAFHYVERKHNC